MKSIERVISTLTFDKLNRIVIDPWLMPSFTAKYSQYPILFEKYTMDIFYPEYEDSINSTLQKVKRGRYKDAWGCERVNISEGSIGEEKSSPLADYNKIAHLKPPFNALNDGMQNVDKSISLNKDKFILSPWGVDVFERMQQIRGPEQLLVDIAEEPYELFLLRDMVCGFYEKWIELWLEKGVDAILFFDDWGTQISLLISPDKFRRIFLPVYKHLFAKVNEKNKFIFFHSDGNISSIYDDLIKSGVDALNSQIWCMNREELAQKYKGKVTFWGELDRQKTLPFGSTNDVEQEIFKMKSLFMENGGGLIGTFVADASCPFQNIIQEILSWNEK